MVSWLMLLILAITLPIAFIIWGGSIEWLFYGVMVWIISVGIKIVFAWHGNLLLSKSGLLTKAITNGIISAVSELGLAALVLIFIGATNVDIPDIMLYAVSAGVTELLIISIYGMFEKREPETVKKWEISAEHCFLARYLFPVERLVALIGHIGSRGLVGIAIIKGYVWPVAVALITFSTTDGLANYGVLKNWDWFNRTILKNFFLATGCLALIELVLLITIILYLS
jgi:hypothetical protein